MNTTNPNQAEQMLDEIFSKLNNALQRGDGSAVAKLFQEECYWRDLVFFTCNLRTLENQQAIKEMLVSQLDEMQPVQFSRDTKETATSNNPMS